ncbi:MAG: Pimeloyl-ACP methyl ester carboxylesterase [Nocardioides sp.]|nr:Pimeloyl-ACP methyl ester carboxylesterase [Nocardioides sp.]
MTYVQQMNLGTRLALLPVALLALVAPIVSAPATAAPAPAERPGRLVARQVVFDLVNNGDGLLRCQGDDRTYQVRGRLVGPRRDVLGRGGSTRINVLVHDAGTGGWFWNLRRHPRYDYASQLARRGQTSLVLDRLGYDSSPLADGDDTCLDAQAAMLHQVVQHLRSGRYDFTRGRATTPHASQVVVHGHGVGATIAQTEAARYDDTHGLVLMSWAGANPSVLSIEQARTQSAACARGVGYAPYGASVAEYRRLLFATAPRRVQETAARLRNATPCGDVASLGPATVSAAASAGRVEVPVLVLSGSRDARLSRQAGESASAFRASAKVTAHTVAGAGSALPLESSAPRTRRLVLRWLHSL